ncbi:uncharacterized protein LOC110857032 [Folsomia candida]|nr:uncharacterized protein LOC110857032 [Folsomia candida]
MTCGMLTPKGFGLATFHPKLAQNVKIVSPLWPCELPEFLPQNFTAARPKIAPHLEELEVNIDSSFLPELHKMWRSKSHRFTNLRKITITVSLSYDENAGTILTASYPAMENVKTISIKMTNQFDNKQDEMAASICQKLLNATPNLQEVEMEASFYLDFAPSKKLTKLTYTFVQFFEHDFMEEPVLIEIDKISEMLECCRESSLTELTLRHVGEGIIDYEEDENDMQQTLSLPSFPKLTRLSISSMDFYHLGDYLSTAHLPNLTHVSLAINFKQFVSLSDIFAHIRHPHVGVTSLHLDAAHDGDEDHVGIGTEILRLFPAVKTLQLKLTVSAFVQVEGDVAIRILKRTLRNFAPWELTSALVEMKYVRSSDFVMGTMQGLKRWKGLAHTEVRLCGIDRLPFVLGDDVKEVLLASRSVKSIKMLGLLMEAEKDEFQRFIEENGLQISLSE